MILHNNRIGPDLILYNGKIATVDKDFSFKEAVVVVDDKIAAVGDNNLKDMAVPGTKLIDLKGRLVSPGVHENHMHLLLAGMEAGGGVTDSRGVPVKAYLLDKPSIEEIKREIKKMVELTPPGEWVVTSCTYRGELKDGRFPNRYDLDPLSDKHPIYVMQSGKNIILNSMALKMAGITRNTPDPISPEGHIVRDENGEPTGHMIAGAGDLVRKTIMGKMGKKNIQWDMLVYPKDVKVKAINNMQKICNACGVTSARDMGVSPDEIDAYVEHHKNHSMTCRVDLILGLPSRYMDITQIREAIDSYFGPMQNFGDEWLTIGGLKVVMQNDSWWSLDPEKVAALVDVANRKGFSLITHITTGGGEEANDYFLELLDKADQVRPIKGRRFTIEHGFQTLRQDAVEKVAKYRMIISASNVLTYFAAGRSLKMKKVMDEVRISKLKEEDPMKRAERDWGLSFRDWVDAGILCTLGSDCPGTPYDPDHPFIQYYNAVTGDTLGGVLYPGQAATREEALRMMTINTAYSMWQENIKGSIEPGKLADFTVYTDDILSIPEKKILDTKCAMTVVGGKVVYEG